jgi:DNA helicase-2/ATP-dependent DNA helicase PcrA
MTTERFSIQDFETALSEALTGSGLSWVNDGYRKNELRFHVEVSKSAVTEVTVEIASSIGPDGFADGTGDNSIRMWVMGGGKPLAAKEQMYVTRVVGWQKRMATVLQAEIAKANDIPLCPKCGNPMKLRTGRRGDFYGCSQYPKCDYTIDVKSLVINTIAEDFFAPPCPQCGTTMQKRNGYKGPFWGCPKYPACRGTRNIGDETKVAEPVAPAKEFIPSKFQKDIFDWVSERKGTHLVVEALAGSGKTTTGVEMLKIIPTTEEVLFVAFNKHIAVELQKRAPSHVKVSTYHSLGYYSVRQAFGNVKVDENKVDGILQGIINKWENRALYSPIKQLVSLVKANLTGTDDAELTEICDHYGIETNGDADTIFMAVKLVVAKSSQMTNVIDYDDMCWLPIFLNLPMKQYDFLFIDELQDTNKVQIALALKSIKDDGRIVGVGDRHQSLYGFRGADVNAVQNVIDALDANTLPLSVTYRNPKCVVELVLAKFTEIPLECPEWAKEGVIRQITANQATVEYTPGDMVLCRTNAPLVEPAFSLIRRGVKAIIRGRDIGSNLLALVRKMKCYELRDMLNKLDIYKANEYFKLVSAEKTNQAQALEDKVNTIFALSDGISTIVELENRIETIFSDDVEGVVFSSVHKAKGLEAERVYILHPELMPHPMAKKDWEREQERNIEYVAITRTLNELIYVV